MEGASVLIGARCVINKLIAAATIWQADVLGARIEIVAVLAALTNALAIYAEVIGGAGVLVIALRNICQMHAADVHIAAVISARIVIIAVKQLT
jgi:hypothetical protein